MKYKTFLSSTALFLSMTGINAQGNITLKQWYTEAHSEQTEICVSGDTLDITSPKGLTLWNKKYLKGDYEISYKAYMVMENGEYDRLSDLNCFWGAKDPENPDNLFARSHWRNGIFQNYKTLQLFYVGYGGNKNSTTRFRQYFSGKPGQNDKEVRPVIKEYKDKDHLLKPNKWYDIRIEVKDGVTRFFVDNEQLFTHKVNNNETDGHFGLRLLTNHVLLVDFKIKHF